MYFSLRFFVVLIICCLSLVACDADSERQGGRVKVYSNLAPKEVDGNIHFILGTKHKFIVPKEYMVGVSHNYLGIPIHANLQALLPNFEGYGESNKKYFSSLGWGRKLFISVDLRRTKLTNQEYMTEYCGNSYACMHILTRKYIDIVHGLEHYKVRNSDWFIYWEDTNPVIIFDCRTHTPSPGCSADWDFSSSIAVNFDFSFDYLFMWEVIFKKIVDILKTESI